MHPKFENIPQSVFPDQRDNEKIFIFCRQYFLTYIFQTLIILFLFLIPLIFFSVSFTAFTALLITQPVLVVDLIILLLVAYYLALVGLFMVIWMRYYYCQFIVTNERVYEKKFKGLFNMMPHEYALSEIIESTFRSRGFWGFIYDIGDISFHLPRQHKEHLVKEVLKAQPVALLVSNLLYQTKKKVPSEKIEPTLQFLGMIDWKVVRKSDPPPAIMNMSMGIKKAQEKIGMKCCPPKGILEKFDLWWWTQLKKEHILYIDYSSRELDILSHKGGSGRTATQK